MSHFNEVANNWDTQEKIERVSRFASSVKEEISLRDNLDILDFGCGTGLLGFEFIDHAKTLLGVDTSDGMLNVFNEKTKNLPNIQSSNINLEKESISQKFDLIVSSMTFHHLINPEDVLKKFSKMLNKDGFIVIIDLETEDGTFHPDNDEMGVKHFGFSAKELSSWAESSEMKTNVRIIDCVKKNGREYNLFLAVFS